MDLTPLYELRDRLKSGAVAGTGLLSEDFRLIRALEGLAPLAGASPVFQKIEQSVRALLSADCKEPAAALLDSLALCDAVLVTQGAVAVAEERAPIPVHTQGSAMANVPYSVLSPILEALTGTGGGRYSFIVDTYSQNPELFQDYRLKNGLVQALGAGYSELADRAEEWLSLGKEDVIPLLKLGFDPMGKREMVRRIHVIEAVAGAAENEFYLSLLENSEKEIRAAAVYALRHDEKNVQQLINLCKTEKGSAKKAAHWALARMNVPEAWEYWNALAEKKPEQAAEFLVLSEAPQAATLIGDILCEFIKPFEAAQGLWNKERADLLRKLLYALSGKSGESICSFYRRAVGLGAALDGKPEGEKVVPVFFVSERSYGTESDLFSIMLPEFLRYSLILNPTEDLCSLAEELFKSQGGSWAAPALTAALLSKDSASAFEAGRAFLKPAFRLFGGKEEKKKTSAAAEALSALYWDEVAQRYYLQVWCWDPFLQKNTVFEQPLKAPLDVRWFKELVGCGTDYDEILMRLLSPGASAERELLAKHFYDAARIFSDNEQYITPLKQLGWTDFKGFFVRYCKEHKRLSAWRMWSYLEELPLSDKEKLEELQQVLKMAQAGKLGFHGGSGVSEVERKVEEYRAKVFETN